MFIVISDPGKINIAIALFPPTTPDNQNPYTFEFRAIVGDPTEFRCNHIPETL